MIIRWLVLLIGATFTTACEAQQATLIDESVKSLVYIWGEANTNPKTGAGAEFNGSGFVISKNGYVLTAYHVVRIWDQQTQEYKDKNQINGSLEDSHHPAFSLDLITKEEKEDIALLRIRSNKEDYPFAPVCWDHLRHLSSGENIIALGFPLKKDRAVAKGTLGNKNASFQDWSGWAAAIPFDYGMSGGPVYGSKNTVIGLIKGSENSLDGTASPVVRWITPIQYAAGLLTQGLYREQCGPPQDRCDVTYDIPSSAAKLLVTDSETSSPVPCARVQVLQNGNSDSVKQDGYTDRNGHFGVYGDANTISLRISHDDYVEPDPSDKFHLSPGSEALEVPLLRKALFRCRVTREQYYRSFVIAHFMSPLSERPVEDLANRISTTLESDLSIALQQYNLNKDVLPAFPVCEDAKFVGSISGKKVSRALGAGGLLYGTVSKDVRQSSYDVETYIVDSYDLLSKPMLVSNKAELQKRFKSNINPKTRLVVLAALVTGLKAEKRCPEAITVAGIIENMNLLKNKGQLEDAVRAVRTQCQQELPQNKLLLLLAH